MTIYIYKSYDNIMHINIHNLINDDINLIEIYLSSNIKKEEHFIDISINEELANKISNKFKKTRELINNIFYKNNLSYIYDNLNDSQVVIVRNIYNDNLIFNRKAKIFNNYYILALKEDKLPTHYFPCTNDIDYIAEYKIKEFRINNRISIIIKEENGIYMSYIQYKHNLNVDLDKIQDTIDSLIRTVEQLY